MEDNSQDSQDKGKRKASSRNTSPSVSSSQGDMADNEMEAGPSSQHSEEAGPPPAPKKKRTRTLTTPHQAAVLHALLAQSRFPTTAMREEVGRAIGLSARKVQIWFQNQRQKARKPRGQNVPLLTRPPQFGPFSNIPSGGALGDASASASGLGSNLAESSSRGVLPDNDPSPPGAPFSSTSSDPYSWREMLSSDAYPRTRAFTPQLSGPGMPGSLGSASPTSPVSSRSAQFGDISRPRTSHTGPSTARNPFATRPFTADDVAHQYISPRSVSPSHRRSLDFAINLPPLRLNRPRSRTFAESDSGRRALGSQHIIPHLRRVASPPAGHSGTRLPPLQPESPFAYDSPLRIPPPFTLQPRPQWDDPSFSPFSRPSPPSGTQWAPYEPFMLPPPGIRDPEDNSTLISSPSRAQHGTQHPSLQQPFSPPTPSSARLPWQSRRPDDDDSTSYDHGGPR